MGLESQFQNFDVPESPGTPPPAPKTLDEINDQHADTKKEIEEIRTVENQQLADPNLILANNDPWGTTTTTQPDPWSTDPTLKNETDPWNAPDTPEENETPETNEWETHENREENLEIENKKKIKTEYLQLKNEDPFVKFSKLKDFAESLNLGPSVEPMLTILNFYELAQIGTQSSDPAERKAFGTILSGATLSASEKSFDKVLDQIFTSTEISDETRDKIFKKFEKIYAKNPALAGKLLKKEADKIREKNQKVKTNEATVEQNETTVVQNEQKTEIFEQGFEEKNTDFLARFQNFSPEQKTKFWKKLNPEQKSTFQNFQKLIGIATQLPGEKDRAAVQKIVNAANLSATGSFEHTLRQICESPDVSADAREKIERSFLDFKPPKIVTASDAIAEAKTRDRAAKKAEKQKTKIDASLRNVDDQILELEKKWDAATPDEREKLTADIAALKKQKLALQSQSAEVEKMLEPEFREIFVRGSRVSRAGKNLKISLDDWNVLAPTQHIFDPRTARRTFNGLFLARELKKFKLDDEFLGAFPQNQPMSPTQLDRSAKILNWLGVTDSGEILSAARLDELGKKLKFLYRDPIRHDGGFLKKEDLQVSGILSISGEPNGKVFENFWRTQSLPEREI
ncbi:hypothetical protein HN954_03635 [bacterium]|jgi:hypothetical protein|nr:hypothetical protein [bacterium]MBT6831468.1 hypothetical protein [bacterium]MBT6996493.1 hypothetical protein [bacterium]MBT7772701.1 hypothetical protein [bacterium]